MRAVFWLLTALALMMRLVTTAPSHGMASGDPLDVLTELNAFCDSTSLPGPDGHHAPAGLTDPGWMPGGLLDGHDIALSGEAAQTGDILYITGAKCWCFAPIRGPPLHVLAARFAQGPPEIS